MGIEKSLEKDKMRGLFSVGLFHKEEAILKGAFSLGTIVWGFSSRDFSLEGLFAGRFMLKGFFPKTLIINSN